MGKLRKTAVFAVTAVFLTGCSATGKKAWTPRENAAISIDRNGKITEYLSDTLDQSYYSFDELKSMLDQEVSAYNAEHGAEKVTVERAEQTEDQVNLTIGYASGEDYASFNNIEFYYGSMINAQLEGYLFDGFYKEIKDGVVVDEKVDGSEVFEDMADSVVIARVPLEVQVPGGICFTSSNADVLRSDVAAASGEKEDETISVVSGEESEDPDRIYIIFEED